MQYSILEKPIENSDEFVPFPLQQEPYDAFPSSAIWSFTGGAILATALNNRVSWPFHLTLPLPLLSLLIPWCKNLSVEKVSSYAASLFSLESIGPLSFFGLGIVSFNYLNHHITPLDQDSLSDQEQKYFLLAQGSLITIHFLARYASYLESPVKMDLKISEKKADIKPNIDFKKTTEKLNKLNRLMEANYQMLRDFINADSFLLENFKFCYQKTQNLLTKPYCKNDSNSHDDQIVKEWRQAVHLFHFNQSIFICLKDFFDKNLGFSALLEKKIVEKGEEKKFSPILNNEMLLLSYPDI